jgi:ABC-type dipeptide/oligopeptide/nickel transport system permease subunit
MLTLVSATGTANTVTDNVGVLTYTFTVGTTTGMTAGTYTGIVDFTALTAVAATKSTPTYTLKTGGDTTTNADVLKSIVALIASINKQIQALQKLILKR